MSFATGPDTPVRVSKEDPASTAGGNGSPITFTRVLTLNTGECWLIYKVDDEHPAIYSDLLLATQKLERWAEARDPLPPKVVATNGLTVMHSQMPGNLFSLCKLKGHCTFTAQAVNIGNDTAEEDPGVEQEGEDDTEHSADKEVEVLDKVKEAAQSIEYIAHFAKAVELYQKKNKNCFVCGSPNHFI